MRDDILHVVLPIVLTDFVNGLLGAKTLTEMPEIMQDMLPMMTQTSASYTEKIDTAFTAILKRHGYK